jgi:hypothetical protein
VDGKLVKELARQSGIAERTLYRAVDELGVKTLPGGFGRPRLWHLCAMSATSCDLCQPQNIGTHDGFGTHGGGSGFMSAKNPMSAKQTEAAHMADDGAHGMAPSPDDDDVEVL